MSASLSPPVIVVPGITASHLRDEYPLDPENVWSVLAKDYERVALHPDDRRYEAREPARVSADRVFEIAYRELVEELRHELSDKRDRPVPVYSFAYDWRQPLDAIELRLGAFVEEVVARTCLMRHYFDDDYAADPRVNLVGHSMGGLVIAGYLERSRKGSRVAKVATLGSPFGGSFEAVLKIATGTADLGLDESRSRERDAARMTPALYHLLPSIGGIEITNGLPKDFFDPRLWQASVVRTLEDYVRRHAVSKRNPRQQAEDLLADLLAEASAHRRRIEALDLGACGIGAGDWLCIAGAASRTRVRLRVENTSGGPVFRLRSQDRIDRWSDGGSAEERLLTGDGTVPLAAALPPFLPASSVVCVTPADFGYWEIQDRLTANVAGFHAILPNMDMLHRMIVRHFTGRRDKHGNTWGRPAPGVETWAPPLALEQKNP